jgi:hypothetical protein
VTDLATALIELSERPPDDPVMRRAITASVRTLNDGVTQITAAVYDGDARRKHHARLVAALRAMAEALG